MSSSIPESVSYETATREDVSLMLEWAAREGWNPGLADADAFWAADPAGFFVARIAQKAVAAISVVNHDDRTAYLGLYLCTPEHRGKGIGFGLWTHAIEHAGHRSIGLDGVAAQEANYAVSGFTRYGTTTRFEGQIPADALDTLPDHVRPIAPEADWKAVAALDTQAIGYTRSRFLASWISDSPERRTFVSEDDGVITGFATIRQCLDGAKIGPIIAPDDASALALLHAAAASMRSASGQTVCGATVIIDIPEQHASLQTQLKADGFTATFQTAQMYRGAPPNTTPLYRAIATMECG